MKVLRSKYFLIVLACYAIYQLVLLTDVQVPELLTSYMNDLLCMPLVFCLILWIIRLVKRQKDVTLPIAGIVGVTLYWAIYFEYYLPTTSAQYTADPVDFALYALGATSFILWQLRTFKKPDALKYDLSDRQ